MKVELLSRDTPGNIMDFVTMMNKTNNMTALVKPNRVDGYFVIEVESVNDQEV